MHWMDTLKELARAPVAIWRSVRFSRVVLNVVGRERWALKTAAWAYRKDYIGRLCLMMSAESLEGRARILKQILHCRPEDRVTYRRDQGSAHEAAMQVTLGDTCVALPSVTQDERATNIEMALSCYRKALDTYTRDRYPLEHAATFNRMADANVDFPWSAPDEHERNLCEAIACCRRALAVYRKCQLRAEYAAASYKLARLYLQHPTMRAQDPAKSLRDALKYCNAGLEVLGGYRYPYPRVDLPTVEERERTLRDEIVYCEAAVDVSVGGAFPVEYAALQENFARGYRMLLAASPLDRARNLRQAIACDLAALTVYTPEKYPTQYAAKQCQMARAHMLLASLTPGESQDDVEKAIACWQRALEFHPRETRPNDYGAIEYSLGRAHMALRFTTSVERARGLRQAMECFRAALRVFDAHSHPVACAAMCSYMAGAYLSLPAATPEERMENISHAGAAMHGARVAYGESSYLNHRHTYGSNHVDVPDITSEEIDAVARKIIAVVRAELATLPEAAMPDEQVSSQPLRKRAVLYVILGNGYEADLVSHVGPPHADAVRRAENLRHAIEWHARACSAYDLLKDQGEHTAAASRLFMTCNALVRALPEEKAWCVREGLAHARAVTRHVGSSVFSHEVFGGSLGILLSCAGHSREADMASRCPHLPAEQQEELRAFIERSAAPPTSP